MVEVKLQALDLCEYFHTREDELLRSSSRAEPMTVHHSPRANEPATIAVKRSGGHILVIQLTYSSEATVSETAADSLLFPMDAQRFPRPLFPSTTACVHVSVGDSAPRSLA